MKRTEGRVRLSSERTVGVLQGDGAELRFPELLTAGDLASVGVDLSDCGLAVLSACTCGAPRFGGGFSAGGLVAALVEAGVQAVVSCMWPVDDPFGCLYADLLYERVVAHLDSGAVPIAAIVAELSTELANMDLETALERLSGMMAPQAGDVAQEELENYRADLIEAGGRPFADPFDWAAFFVTGAPVVTFAPRR